MELIPVKYCVTIEIRNSKLNLVIVKPPRLLSNLGGSLQALAFLGFGNRISIDFDSIFFFSDRVRCWNCKSSGNGGKK
jgi:hypothetical protein